MAKSIFDLAADELESRSDFEKLEARGTVRLALKGAGLDPREVTASQMAELPVAQCRTTRSSAGCARVWAASHSRCLSRSRSPAISSGILLRWMNPGGSTIQT